MLRGGKFSGKQSGRKWGLEKKIRIYVPTKKIQDFDSSLKQILTNGKNLILETKLAGFNAQGIPGVFKIAVLCEDDERE
jgi:hypothetical protein